MLCQRAANSQNPDSDPGPATMNGMAPRAKTRASGVANLALPTRMNGSASSSGDTLTSSATPNAIPAHIGRRVQANHPASAR